MNFCRRCGEALTASNDFAYKCKNDHSSYINASPTAGIFFVTDDNQVLLSRRGIEPNKGMLDSIGGFVDAGETAEDAIAREILEETELTSDQYETPQIFCTGYSLYRFENEDRPVLSTFFWSKLHPGAQPRALDDVAEIVYLPLSTVDEAELGGDDIKEGMRVLKTIRGVI